MSQSTPFQPAVLLPQDQARDGKHYGMGFSHIDFKVTAQDSPDLFVLENIFHRKGGPARHLHVEQDEWFFVIEGEFIFEVGEQRMRLKPGDSLFAPRKVPHVWAYVGDGRGRILIAFTPAGKMEAFFREVTQANAMPLQYP